MRAEDIALNLLALLIHINDIAGRLKSLAHTRQRVEKWKVKRGIHAYNIACFADLGVATNEARDLLLVVIDLAKGEKVLFADTERKFAYGVGKHACEVGADILQGINTEAINIVPGDN